MLIAPVRPDQVGIVDIGVIDVLARLHLRLQLFDNVTFADQVMGDLDAGDRFESGGQNGRFVCVRADCLGHDVDRHAFKRFCSVDKELQFGFLVFPRQRGEIADFLIKESLCGLHVGERRCGKHASRKPDRSRSL